MIKELVLLAVLMMFTANKGHSQLPVQVKVVEGWIQGSTENGLTVFRGIPFAAPPVGNLRRKGPQPLRNWDGVKQAFHFAASPMQGGKPASGKSEDCLYLNVWTSAKSEKDQLPVMVWIYGGGFGSGFTSDPPWFDGQKLAQKGVVFVSIAYRV